MKTVLLPPCYTPQKKKKVKKADHTSKETAKDTNIHFLSQHCASKSNQGGHQHLYMVASVQIRGSRTTREACHHVAAHSNTQKYVSVRCPYSKQYPARWATNRLLGGQINEDRAVSFFLDGPENDTATYQAPLYMQYQLVARHSSYAVLYQIHRLAGRKSNSYAVGTSTYEFLQLEVYLRFWNKINLQSDRSTARLTGSQDAKESV